jgi:hypothetical protein
MIEIRKERRRKRYRMERGEDEVSGGAGAGMRGDG